MTNLNKVIFCSKEQIDDRSFGSHVYSLYNIEQNGTLLYRFHGSSGVDQEFKLFSASI